MTIRWIALIVLAAAGCSEQRDGAASLRAQIEELESQVSDLKSRVDRRSYPTARLEAMEGMVDDVRRVMERMHSDLRDDLLSEIAGMGDDLRVEAESMIAAALKNHKNWDHDG